MRTRPARALRWVAVSWILAAAPALANVPCDTISFPSTPFDAIHEARVGPGPRAPFRSGRGACPDDSPACRQSAYVVPGDRLLTGTEHGAYSCGYYSDGKSETAGWLPTARLERRPAAKPDRGAWLGAWRYGDSTLNIRPSGAGLSVSAHAYWPSKSDPDGHEGHLDATAIPSGATLALADPDDDQGCRLTLALLSTSLVAHDNGACGGANVSLSGVYRRAR